MTAARIPDKFASGTVMNLQVRLSTILFTVILAFVAPCRAQSEPIRILVLKEHGVGSPTLAQPYLDRFVAAAAQYNQWGDAKGQYYTTRTAAEQFIESQKPHYGIISLAAFLDFRIKYGLEVIGKVAVSLVGGQQYFLISKTAKDLAGCKGKKLASDHTTDKRFIEKVVARGEFVLSDFTLDPTQRPLQTIKEVVSDAADCALIDDAQASELAKLTTASDVKTVWSSPKLPPMVVAAFPSAPTAERLGFQRNFNKVCESDAKPACAEVGILSLDMASAADYASVVAAYGGN
ncbi:MAG TPA: hypothetical protein VN634_09255 [Candidatus Limnocylindrales bacterium]|nr:hypothetical protein [Candidatus Limnocylindrales bacterium]